MRFAVALAAALIALLPLAAPAQEDPESVYAKFHRSLHAGDVAAMIRYGSEPGASLFSDKQETQYGTIRMVKQGGEWKVDGSSWDGKPHAAGSKPVMTAEDMEACR